MTYRGQVRNGQIVLERDARLEEGAAVEVTLIEPPSNGNARGTPQAILSSRARWVGSDSEAEQLLRALRQEKWAEVEAQRAQPDAQL